MFKHFQASLNNNVFGFDLFKFSKFLHIKYASMYLKHRKYEAYLSILCWLKKSTKTEKRIETVNKRSCMAFESKKCKFKIRKK